MRILLLFFLVSIQSLFSQTNVFTLSGKVTDCKRHFPLQFVDMELICSDSRVIKATTDSTGSYHFNPAVLKPNREYVLRTEVTQVTHSIGGKNNRRGYMGSSERIKFNTFDSLGKNFNFDFCLIPNEGCTYGPPLAYFKKNSSTSLFYDDSLDGTSATVMILQDNPTFIIEVAGHAGSDEKNPEKLAKARADFLRDLLIKKGIEPERLICKAYADKRPIEIVDDDGSLLKMDPASEKNRRVVISVVGRDYISTKPQPQVKQKQDRSEEE